MGRFYCTHTLQDLDSVEQEVERRYNPEAGKKCYEMPPSEHHTAMLSWTQRGCDYLHRPKKIKSVNILVQMGEGPKRYYPYQGSQWQFDWLGQLTGTAVNGWNTGSLFLLECGCSCWLAAHVPSDGLTHSLHISGDQLFTSDMRAAEHSVFGKRHYYYPCTLKMKILEAIISRFNNE